jgi:hypothetical protein
MADRNRGEKSTVRIARSSSEQNGYERHRTRPVPVSSGGTLMASRSPHGDVEKIWNARKSFKGRPKKFFDSKARGKYLVRDRGAQARRRLPCSIGLFGSGLFWTTSRSASMAAGADKSSRRRPSPLAIAREGRYPSMIARLVEPEARQPTSFGCRSARTSPSCS